MYMRIMMLGITSAAAVGLAMAADQKLSGEQIKSMYAGKTFHIDWTDGKNKDTGTQTLSSKGSSSVKMKSGWVDQGTWTIKGDKLCQKWRKGMGGCFPVYIVGNKHVWKGGGQQTVFSR